MRQAVRCFASAPEGPVTSFVEKNVTPAVGVMLTVIATAFVSGGVIVSLESCHNAKIATLEERINGSEKMLKAEMAGLTGKVDERVNGLAGKVDERVNGLAGKVAADMGGLKEVVATAIGGMEKLAESKAKGEAQYRSLAERRHGSERVSTSVARLHSRSRCCGRGLDVRDNGAGPGQSDARFARAAGAWRREGMGRGPGVVFFVGVGHLWHRMSTAVGDGIEFVSVWSSH